VVSLRSSHTPCMGSLFLQYPSRLAWSCLDLLTRLCVGSLFFMVFVTSGVVSSRSSHTSCVGSLFSRYPSCLAWSRCSYRGGGRSAGSRVERGRSVERDNRLRVFFPFRLSAHSRLGVIAVFHVPVAVFGFAVALFGFALIFFTPGVVSLRYSTSRWRYSASP